MELKQKTSQPNEQIDRFAYYYSGLGEDMVSFCLGKVIAMVAQVEYTSDLIIIQ